MFSLDCEYLSAIPHCYTFLLMKFQALQENLRKALWERIQEGDLTGLRLARETGFKQAHISNFLNRKRGLSIEGMDKVLNVERLSVLDLLDPSEINKRASIPPPGDDEFQNVLMVEGSVAATEPLLIRMNVKEIIKFKKNFLRKLRRKFFLNLMISLTFMRISSGSVAATLPSTIRTFWNSSSPGGGMLARLLISDGSSKSKTERRSTFRTLSIPSMDRPRLRLRKLEI